MIRNASDGAASALSARLARRGATTMRSKRGLCSPVSRHARAVSELLARYAQAACPWHAVDYEKLSKVAATESSVVPCCVQHADTKEVLIIAYAARRTCASATHVPMHN